MNEKKLKFTVAITAIILVFIVFSLSIFLNTTSFRQNYVDSLISTYRVIGGESVRNIEHAIRYGKDLNKFYGIENILEEIKEVSAQIDNVRIVIPDGAINYDLDGEVIGERLSSELSAQLDFSREGSKEYENILAGDNYYLFIPIYNRDDQWTGSLELSFARDVIDGRTNIYLRSLVRDSVLLALLAIAILLYLIFKFDLLNKDGELRQKFIIIIILIMLGTTQLAATFINYQVFNRGYLDITRENAQTVTEIIRNDVNSIIDKGVGYDSLYGIENWLADIVDSIPQIKRVYLSDEQDNIIFNTLALEDDFVIDGQYLNSGLLAIDLRGEERIVNVQTSQAYINSQLREIILDMLTIMIVSFVFTVELTLFAIIFLKDRLKGDKKAKEVDVNTNRSLGFLFFLASTMPLSFIPLVMNDLYRPFFGLSKDVVLGLPISIETVFAGLSISFIGILIEKKGWKPIFMVSLFLFIAGSFLSGLAWDPLIFILSRAIVGIAYGACLAAMMNLAVLMVKTSQEKNKSLAGLTAGIFAGSNCGVVMGGMFADIMGFYKVFWLTAGLSIFTALFALKFLPNFKGNQEQKVKNEASQVSSKEFFGNLSVSVYFLMLLIPTTVAIMFLNYFFPLFARDLGVSSSNISRAFLINGLMIVYLGPVLTKFISKKITNKNASILATLVTVIAFLIFFIRGDLLAAFLVVILLGVADSFGLVVRNNYLLDLKVGKDLGESKVLGYYNMARKLAQAIGPIVFATVLTLGRQRGVGMIALILLIGVIGFKLMATDAEKNIKGGVSYD